MNWGAIIGIFFSAFIKFMFAPFVSARVGLDFYTTWIVVFSGGLVSAFVFYFASEYFTKRNHDKKIKKYKEALQSGKPLKLKKSFTKVNKYLVKFKHSIGQKGICVLAPLFLSVPIGSIVCAKFYGKSKKTFPIIVFGLAMNSFILSILAFTIFK